MTNYNSFVSKGENTKEKKKRVTKCPNVIFHVPIIFRRNIY